MPIPEKPNTIKPKARKQYTKEAEKRKSKRSDGPDNAVRDAKQSAGNEQTREHTTK